MPKLVQMKKNKLEKPAHIMQTSINLDLMKIEDLKLMKKAVTDYLKWREQAHQAGKKDE